MPRPAAVLAVLLLAAGCGGGSEDSDVIARVGDRVITIGDFETYTARVSPEYLPADRDLEGKKEFLDTIIKKELMAYKADELGYDKNPSLQGGKEHFERGALISLFYQKNAREKAEENVTVEDARECYRKLGLEVDLRQIVVNRKEQAEELRERILAGEDMAELAKQYSKSTTAKSGGLVRGLPYGSTKVEFEDPVFALKKGEVSQPFLTQYGWTIVKILRKNKQDVGSWEEQKDYCMRLARGREEARTVNKLRQGLLEKAGFEVDPEVRKIVYDALPPDIPLEEAPRRSEEEHPILKFDEEDLDRVLCRFDDEEWTVAYFSDLYDNTNFHRRPRREHNWRGIDNYIVSMIIDRLIVREANRQNLDQDPTYVASMKMKDEEMMVSVMHEELINADVEVLPSEVKDYYEEHLDAYRKPETRNFRVILTRDRDAAQEAYDLAQQGRNFIDLVMKYSQDEGTRENEGETGAFAMGSNPALEDVGFALEHVGDVSEPFEVADRGWAVLQLIDIEDPQQLSLDEARDYVRRDIRTLRADEKLEEYLTQWRKEVPIEINEKNLEKARFVSSRRG
jgi:parvulin-like peptidyl-prolyl isomerase